MKYRLNTTWGLGLGLLLASGAADAANTGSQDPLFNRVDTASVCEPELVPAIYIQPVDISDVEAKKARAAQASNISIEADEIESARNSGQMNFIGHAEAEYGGRRITGDRLGYNKDTSVLTGKDNVHLLNQFGDAMVTDSLNMNTETQIGETGSANFTIGDRSIPVGSDSKAVMQARGSAAGGVEFQGQNIMRLDNATYTTCKNGNDDVVVKAKQVDLDMTTGVGVARNATIRFLGVPVMYTPYVSFPIGNQRKSGLLSPTVGKEGDSGTTFMLPYYFNIAPNMDATLTPKYMSERGLELMGEYRYLTDSSVGLFRGEYLPGDKLYNDEDRWGVYYQHDQALGDYWTAGVLYKDVSDVDYLDDLVNDLATSSDSFLPQQVTLGYADDIVQMNADFTQYQTVDRKIKPANEPYKTLPRISLAAFNPSYPNYLHYGVDSEFALFDKSDATTGQRLYAQPSISLPLETVYGFLTPKVGVSYVGYSLSNLDATATTDTTADSSADFGDTADSSGTTTATTDTGGTVDLSDNPSITVPMFSLDSGLYFDRDATMSGREYTQTLEPRVYYLYVPEENQDDFPVFDTSRVGNTTVSNLFLENRFNSYDRIGDTNQITLALTSRLLDFEDGTEVLKGSIGQIYYLDDRQVTLTGEPDTSSTSGIVMELAAKLGKRTLTPREKRLKEVNLENYRLAGNDWYTGSEIGSERVNIGTQLVWDTEQDAFSRATLDFAYTPNMYTLFDVQYTLGRNSAGDTTTNQFNINGVVPFTKQLFGYGGYRYDTLNSQILETKAGVEYRSCCWAFRLYGTRRINTSSSSTDEYRDALMAELELTGLATVRSKSGLQ